MNKLEFAKALREPNPDFDKKLNEQFASQADLFTTCQKCGSQVSGTMPQIKSHVCFVLGC